MPKEHLHYLPSGMRMLLADAYKHAEFLSVGQEAVLLAIIL